MRATFSILRAAILYITSNDALYYKQQCFISRQSCIIRITAVVQIYGNISVQHPPLYLIFVNVQTQSPNGCNI